MPRQVLNLGTPTPGYVGIRIRGASLPPASAIDNNLIYGPATFIAAEVGGTNRTWAQYQALGFDAAGVNADPMFVNPTTDPATANYATQPGSPARGAGATIAAVATDRAGIARTVPYDIGAHESA